MEISLNYPKHFMWFLGQPKNIICHLTEFSPGPVSLDYDNLTNEDKKLVMIAIRDGIIKSDIDFNTLYDEYNKQFLPSSASVPIVPQSPVLPQPSYEEILAERVEKRKEKTELENKKLEEKCQKMLALSAKKFVEKHSSLRDEKTIRKCLAIEQSKKNRVEVIETLKTRLLYLETLRAKEIRKKMKTQLYGLSKETKDNFMIHSEEEETIILSPADLISLT